MTDTKREDLKQCLCCMHFNIKVAYDGRFYSLQLHHNDGLLYLKLVCRYINLFIHYNHDHHNVVLLYLNV